MNMIHRMLALEIMSIRLHSVQNLADVLQQLGEAGFKGANQVISAGFPCSFANFPLVPIGLFCDNPRLNSMWSLKR